MKRILLLGLLLAWHLGVLAQFPFVRSFEVRAGQQRPRITGITQDAQGSIWLATDVGLIRTDLERTDVVLRSSSQHITALGSRGNEVYTAWDDGRVLRCVGNRCDTLFRDTLLVHHPARAVVRDGRGILWVGAYGGGVVMFAEGAIKHFGLAQGLNDDHVNDLCLVDEDKVAVATDQGIAILTRHGLLRRIREQEGLPDNLVLSLTMGANGRVFAGTDRSGVLSFLPHTAKPRIQVVDSIWIHGPVRSMAWGHDMVWAATALNGLVITDTRHGLASYRPSPELPEALVRIVDIAAMSDGSVLWCDGTDKVYRGDPHVLMVPRHEDHDLRHITALCVDGKDRIWFATPEGVFDHGAAFTDQFKLARAPLEQDPRMPVVCLQPDGSGAIWAGTFGDGVYRIHDDGHVAHFAESDGLANNSVLSIRTRGQEVWFATLGGICSWTPGKGFASRSIPGSGFVYDVLPMPDGSVLAATDGTGLVRWGKDGRSHRLGDTRGPSSYYSLCLDASGQAWACGPGTGLCRIAGDSVICHATGRSPFDGNVYGIACLKDRILAMGQSGVAFFDPRRDDLLEVGASIGMADVTAELNTLAVDAQGDLWLACDRGLVRITTDASDFTDRVPCAITGLEWAGEELPMGPELVLRSDQNFLTFHFAAPYLPSPENVRFQYRLTGYDNIITETRDREVNWSRLPPGQYTFELRAYLVDDRPPEEWVTLRFTIRAPWYRTAWAIAAMVMALGITLILFLRGREARVRFRDRVEKEKARFQLDALRSQVNPHFLFNSFNTLIELIEEDKDKAVEHVEHLSEFFRNILMVRDKELIPLREELRLLDTYFYLEQRRFGERIALHTLIPEGLREHLLPPLTLQLLVENAIKHNAATTATPLVVEVTAVDGSIEVVNPIHVRKAALPSTGFGVDSIRQRYAALTDRPVEVTNDGVYFRVRIPLIEKP